MLRSLLLFVAIAAFCFTGFTQPANDDCSGAARICPGLALQGTTTAATGASTEDYSLCAFTQATVWYVFTSTDSGACTINITNLSFNTNAAYGQIIQAVVVEAPNPCDESSYIAKTNCDASGVDFTLSPTSLDSNKTYFIMINGSVGGGTNPAECDFDISITGPAMAAPTPPTASINALTTVLCQGDDVPVETIIANCADTVSFNWHFNNVLISSSATNDFNTENLTGPGYLKLIINCGNICVLSDTTDSIYFDVTPIEAYAGPDESIQEGEIVTLAGTGVGTPLWTPANTLTNPNIFQPSANPTITTTYFLIVTSGSCTATDSVNVLVDAPVIIFSAFSPNEDLINDRWVIENASLYENMEVTVYDRSGQRVFHTIGYSTQNKWWDGTHNSKPLPVSTYFYVVDLKIGDDGIYKGQVNIMR